MLVTSFRTMKKLLKVIFDRVIVVKIIYFSCCCANQQYSQKVLHMYEISWNNYSLSFYHQPNQIG